MLTAQYPLNLEVEHEERKIVEVAPNCLLLAAGNALVGTEILRRFSTRRPAEASIPALASALLRSFQEVRLQKAEELYLRPRNLTFSLFTEKGSQMIPVQLYAQLDQQLATFDIGAEYIICGVDSEGGHIVRLRNPGTLDWLDVIGFDATGTGGIHASLMLLSETLGPHSRNKGLIETLYAVYAAKRRAEVAPGVGRDYTDLAVVTEKETRFVDEQTLAALKAAYEGTPKEVPNLSRVKEAYDAAARR
jgi:20S proteasome alpha/beta subunit